MGNLNDLHFNLVVHEFEGLLFARTSALKGIANEKQLKALHNICENEGFETPEHINNSYDTVPSRRIKK